MLPGSRQSSLNQMFNWSTQHVENPAANRYVCSLSGQDKNEINKSDEIPEYGILRNPLLERNSEINLNTFVEAQSKTIPFDFIAASSMSGSDHAMPDNNDFMKYIDLLDKDRRDMEKRLTDDRKDMENRLASERKDSEDRINKSIDDLKEEFRLLRGDIKDQKKFQIATVVSIVGLVIATAAIAISAFYGSGQLASALDSLLKAIK